MLKLREVSSSYNPGSKTLWDDKESTTHFEKIGHGVYSTLISQKRRMVHQATRSKNRLCDKFNITIKDGVNAYCGNRGLRA